MFKGLTTRQDNPYFSWQKEMNSLFDKFSKELSLSRNGLEEFEPKIELKDSDKSYFVRAEIPGMSEKDIKVSLRDRCLILEGERQSESKREEKGRSFSEFSYGSFYRTLPFDEEVDPEKVNASYKDGILTVELTKLSSAHPAKSIPITKH